MSDKIKYLNDQNFNESIAQGLSLVDFYADWCGPCRMIAPIMEQLADEMAGKVTVGKLNIDENQKVTSEYNVTSIPTVILFKDGKAVQTVVGVRDAKTYKELIAAH